MRITLSNALPWASALLVTGAAAFTLDFADLALGTAVPGAPADLCLSVAGYGNVLLQSAPGSDLELANHSGLKAVNFNLGETLVVTFVGETPDTDPNLAMESLSSGENFALQGTGPNTYEVTFSGTNGAVSAIHFVPEPSTLLLVSCGLLALIRRR